MYGGINPLVLKICHVIKIAAMGITGSQLSLFIIFLRRYYPDQVLLTMLKSSKGSGHLGNYVAWQRSCLPNLSQLITSTPIGFYYNIIKNIMSIYDLYY